MITVPKIINVSPICQKVFNLGLSEIYIHLPSTLLGNYIPPLGFTDAPSWGGAISPRPKVKSIVREVSSPVCWNQSLLKPLDFAHIQCGMCLVQTMNLLWFLLPGSMGHSSSKEIEKSQQSTKQWENLGVFEIHDFIQLSLHVIFSLSQKTMR